MSGEWSRVQTRIPLNVRDLYDCEMQRYGIKTQWKHDPRPNAALEIKEPLHLQPWPSEFSQVTAAYARHIRDMQPLMEAVAATAPAPINVIPCRSSATRSLVMADWSKLTSFVNRETISPVRRSA